MNFTPESLIQIYLNGAMTDEAQQTFDLWLRNDPAFTQALVQALKDHLGQPPESLRFSEARLDAEMDRIWTRNKPSFSQILIRKYPKQLLGLAMGLLLAWALVHWGYVIVPAMRAALHLTPPADTTTAPPVIATPTFSHKHFKTKKAFIPNGVSYGYVNHALQIVIDSNHKQKVAITILDAHGSIVCNVYQGPWIPGHHVVTWNGKNALGNLVTPGKYTVVVQANGQTTSSIINFPDF